VTDDPEGGALERRNAPLDLDADAFARAGHKMVDRIADLLRTLPDRPVTPGESADQVRAALGADRPLPDKGTDAEALLEHATELLIEHSLYNGHPRFFGYITAAPAPVGILGDLLASAVNPNMGGWMLSPMGSEIEAQSVRWIAQLLGYPSDGGGILTSGGNVANMLAFWAARAAKAGWAIRDTGMTGVESVRLCVYGSAETHTWIQKAADLSGLGSEAVRWIASGPDQRMDLAVLRSAIEEDLAAGDRPFMVVGTGGSVSTGAVDDLPGLRGLCDEYDLWFHVDGAYGGFAVAASGVPEDLLGLRLADSVAVDPHKWLYTPLEAGCTLVRDPEALLNAFSYRPPYYSFEEELVNYFEHGIQNSRGFRALKVWLQLQQAGRAGYERMITEDIELARRFHTIVEGNPELQAFTHGLSITTYRYVPEDLRDRVGEGDVEEYLNELNQGVQARLDREGRAFVSNAVLDDRYLLRMCIVNFRTSLEDVEALADISVEAGRAADAELRPDGLG
jgi:glutamate/tyrosine decarboxylase-like PLP-dependent enzyme